jgi:hypothetical protein
VKDSQKFFFYDAVLEAGCMTHNGPAIKGGRAYRNSPVGCFSISFGKPTEIGGRSPTASSCVALAEQGREGKLPGAASGQCRCTLAGSSPGASQVRRSFCWHGSSFIGCRWDRGTNLIAYTVIITDEELNKLHWRSIAVQTRPKPENYPGAEVKLRAVVRVRVH